MKRAHRVYLFRRQLGIFALFGFLFNGMLGWLLYQLMALPRNGVIVGADALVMVILTAFFIGPAVMPHAVQKIRRAQLPPVARRSRSRVWVQRLPADVLTRTVVVGLAVAAVIVPLSLSLLAVAETTQVSPTQFVIFRAVLAAGAAGLMAAVFTWIGLVEAS